MYIFNLEKTYYFQVKADGPAADGGGKAFLISRGKRENYGRIL